MVACATVALTIKEPVLLRAGEGESKHSLEKSASSAAQAKSININFSGGGC